MTDAELSAAIEQLRPQLRLHCYRMLGSAHDSDDMVQEAILRAWRARATLGDPARARPWLYRIATNVCFDELARRSRRGLASDLYPPAPGDAPVVAPAEDAPWLEPIPDAWLAGAGTGGDPEAQCELRESVALAFVAALQVLSPPQRATLLLRDVVGLSADETADALEQSVSATNSALHRARVALEEQRPAREHAPERAHAELLARYVRALEAHDLDAMLALAHEDMHTTMPPSPTWIRGYADTVPFYRAMFARWAGVTIRAVPIGVNGGLGCTFARDGKVTAVEAIEVRDGKLFRIHHFMQPAVIALFTAA